MDVQTGDILIYYEPFNIAGDLVIIGEELEYRKQAKEYYHCAIALDAKKKIEAQGVKVEIADIDYQHKFDIIRFPLNLTKIELGLSYIKSMEGQKYDWTLIVDDALRYLTHNIIHLPKSLVAEQEEHKKICSTLVQKYMGKVGLKVDDKFDSPEDIYLLGKSYIIHR